MVVVVLRQQEIPLLKQEILLLEARLNRAKRYQKVDRWLSLVNLTNERIPLKLAGVKGLGQQGNSWNFSFMY